jgi:hypothetical protein
MSVPVRRRREKGTEEFSWLMKAQQHRLSRQPKESRRREGRQAELWLMKESFLLNEIIPNYNRDASKMRDAGWKSLLGGLLCEKL